MAREQIPQPPIHLVSAQMLDVEKGELVSPRDILIEGDRVVDIAPGSAPRDAVEIDLGDLTLLPGLMDMEVNLLLGGPTTPAP